MADAKDLPDNWRKRGMRATDIRPLPGPAPESIAYYECARDLENVLADAEQRGRSEPEHATHTHGMGGGDEDGYNMVLAAGGGTHRDVRNYLRRLRPDYLGKPIMETLLAYVDRAEAAESEQRGRSEAEGWIGPGTFPDEDSWAWVDCGGASVPRPMQWYTHHWWGSDNKGNPLALRMGHVVRYWPLPPPPVPSEVEK